MSLKSAPYYWVECDDCGLSAQEGGDHAAWAQDWAAQDEANCGDFRTVIVEGGDLLHYCLDCGGKRGLEDDE